MYGVTMSKLLKYWANRGVFSILLLTNTVYPNMLLQPPKKFTLEQIEALINNYETQFKWSINGLADFTCYYKNGTTSVMVRLLHIPIYFFHLSLRCYLDSLRKSWSKKKRSYYVACPLKIDDPNPQKIDFDQLVALLENKRYIFYTGAGVSAASNVPTMIELEKSLKLNGAKEFLKELLRNPKNIVDQFGQFCKSALYAEPTAAHYALKAIALKKSVSILTENIDVLQEKTGVLPIHTDSDVIHELRKIDLEEVDIVVCVGLSHDDRGLLALYKEQNPRGVIIALDLGMPKYLSGSDFLLSQDVQMLLPNLAHALKVTNSLPEFGKMSKN